MKKRNLKFSKQKLWQLERIAESKDISRKQLYKCLKHFQKKIRKAKNISDYYDGKVDFGIGDYHEEDIEGRFHYIAKSIRSLKGYKIKQIDMVNEAFGKNGYKMLPIILELSIIHES